MFENPAWATSSSGASVEPLMTAMQSPRRIASAASPTLCVPVAQADTMHTLWPIAPVSMAIIPERAVDERVGDERRRDGPRALLVERHVVVDHQLLAAGARAEDDADLGPVLVGQLEAGVGQRLLAGGDPEVQARLAAARGLGVHPLLGVEVAGPRRRPWPRTVTCRSR